jgi:hypothetical protein
MASKSGLRRREPFGFSSDAADSFCAATVGAPADEFGNTKRLSDRRSFDPELEEEVGGEGDLIVATRQQILSFYGR